MGRKAMEHSGRRGGGQAKTAMAPLPWSTSRRQPKPWKGRRETAANRSPTRRRTAAENAGPESDEMRMQATANVVTIVPANKVTEKF